MVVVCFSAVNSCLIQLVLSFWFQFMFFNNCIIFLSQIFICFSTVVNCQNFLQESKMLSKCMHMLYSHTCLGSITRRYGWGNNRFGSIVPELGDKKPTYIVVGAGSAGCVLVLKLRNNFFSAKVKILEVCRVQVHVFQNSKKLEKKAMDISKWYWYEKISFLYKNYENRFFLHELTARLHYFWY